MVPPRAESQPESLIDAAPAMIWVTAAGGEGERFNAGWLAFTGRSHDDELGEGWLDSVHPADRLRLVESVEQCSSGGREFELEFRVRRADGVYRWLLVRGVPSPATLDSAAGCVSVGLDVTDRRRTEADRTERLAGSGAENARLAALQELTARLAAIEAPTELAGVVLGRGVAELGATTASLCLLDADGAHLEVAAQLGYPDEITEHWGRFRLDAPTPAGDAVRDNVGIYICTLGELHERYPIFKGTPIVGDEALAVLPLVADEAGALGAMVFGFAHSRDFTHADRRMLEALAAQAATALARTRARAALEAARAQLAYLADASARLSTSLDLDHTVTTIADLAVPLLSDRCGIFLLTEGRVEARHWAPAAPDLDVARFDCHPIGLADEACVGAVLRSGVTQFAPGLDESTGAATERSDEHYKLLRQDGVGAILVLPLRARSQVIGALTLTNAAGRAMTDQDRMLAEELAARAAVAIDNAQLFAAQVSVARRLQASLLPPDLPVIPGLELAARYAPAGHGVDVGGDFYDCISAGDDRWLLVVGDVKGKGIDAAALTGMARHTIRAAATPDRGPAAVLSYFNDVLCRYEAERSDADLGWEAAEPRFCSVVAVAIRRTCNGFAATVASAGHPLPLLRRPDGLVVTLGQAGGVLGIDPANEMPEVVVDLMPGSTLVCFTDGVSECHDGGRFLGEAGIAQVLAATTGNATHVVAEIEAATRRFAPAGIISDDIAILAIRMSTSATSP